MHHVIELTPINITDKRVALNPDNLISLCHDCHTKVTNKQGGDVADGYEFNEFGQVVQLHK